jgi:hypothetical protein
MANVYKDDLGVGFEIETGVDCSTAGLVKTLEVIKPDGTAVSWSATLKAGDNSILEYTSQSGDLNQSGEYKLQSKIASGQVGISGYSGYSGYSGAPEILVGDTAYFRVRELGD